MLLFSMKKLTKQQERGQRIRELRRQGKLSRRAFAERHGLSENTLKAWEQGLQGGLSEKGAKTLVYIFRKEGIQCSVEWLMNGKGLPIDYATKTDKQVYNNFIAGQEHLQDELAYYKQRYPSATYLAIDDDGMLPFFAIGDIVAGIMIPRKDFVLAINQVCIIETEHETKLVRRVMPGSKTHCFHLFCTNLETSVETPIIYNIGIHSIAPVNWHRKLFKSQ